MILVGLLGGVIVLLVALLGLLAWRLHGARTGEAVARGRMAALLANDASGLAVWDGGGRLVACNERFREFYPSVTLKRGLEYEDLVRYTATRAVLLIPEQEIDAWIEAHLGHLTQATTEEHRTPDARWIEIRTRPTDQGETLLIYTDVTAAHEAATAAADVMAGEAEAPADGIASAATAHAADLRMLRDAVTIGREAVSFHAAARDLLRVVAEWGGWDAGTAYLAAAEGDEPLISTGVWHVGERQSLSVTARGAIDACCGDVDDHVLHRAAASAEPTWVAAIAVDPRFSDARRLALRDLRSLCALPVIVAGQVVAVVELFSRDALPPDVMRQRLLGEAADQLARVFERERAALIAGADART